MVLYLGGAVSIADKILSNSDLVIVIDFLFGMGFLIQFLKWFLSNKSSTSIKKLKNLKRLNLKGNPISEEEQARLLKELPNCKITF